jgi:hypothetical protein
MAKITTGKTQLNVEDTIGKMLDSVLKKVVPDAERLISSTFEEIEREAVKEWPRQAPLIRKNKDGKVVFYKERSGESWKKFELGKRLEKGQIVIYLRNTAPYSWAIKFGYDSVNKDNEGILQPRGKRASTELLVKPMRKQVNKIVKVIANELDRGM